MSVISNIVLAFRKLLEKDKDDALNSKILTGMNAEYFAKTLREDFEVYKLFYDVFVRAIVGMRRFDSIVSNWTKGDRENTLATCSDEAMALLGFENSYEVWQNVYEKSKGQIHPIPKHVDYPKEWISTKKTKYTTKRNADGTPIDTNDRQWSRNGILCYNELLHETVRDRLVYCDFIEDYIKWKKDQSSELFRKQIERKEKLPDTDFLNFYDPDNLNEESFSPVSKKEKENEENIEMEKADKEN